jgi:hypothetical protein
MIHTVQSTSRGIGYGERLGQDFIRTSTHHEYDSPQGIGAIPSEMRLMAAMPWGRIVLTMNTHLSLLQRERERFIENPLVRIHFIFVMIKWTGLAP